MGRRLKETGASRPVRIESATILFTDFVHFSETTRGIDPVSVIAMLDDYFAAFDEVVARRGFERLKTIGDGYMCAGGVPKPNRTHPVDACLAALGMLDAVEQRKRSAGPLRCSVRIGINTGPVIAGIIGKARYSYDIWGEAVNLASRHESSGIEGGVNVSKSTYLLTRGLFEYEERGPVEIKGGMKMEMYRLLGPQSSVALRNGESATFEESYRRIREGEVLLC